MQEKGLSPYKVSKEAHVSQPTLSDWKRGKSEPKRATLQKICNTYGLPISYFYEEQSTSSNEQEGPQSEQEKRYMEYAKRLVELEIDLDKLDAIIEMAEKFQK